MKAIITCLTILISLPSLASNDKAIEEKYNLRKGTPTIGSLNEMVFGDDGILFIADSKNAKIFAIDTDDTAIADEMEEFCINDIETVIADRLGVDVKDLLFHDMAVNPQSKNVYLSLSLNRKEWVASNVWTQPNGVGYSNLLVKVDILTKEITEVNLNEIFFSEMNVMHAPKDTTSRRKSTITDMKYNSGKLYVAGMSNEDFDSSFRIIDFPFNGKSVTTKLEMFHYIHNQYETKAPINVFEINEAEEETKLLAVFYCSPLVSFDLNQFKDGDLVRGETLGELWPGASKPLDMISYTYSDIKYAIVTLSARGLAVYRVDDINKFEGDLEEKRKHLTPSDDFSTDTGVPFKIYPGAVQQLENFSDNHLIALQRMQNGNLSLRLRPKRHLSIW